MSFSLSQTNHLYVLLTSSYQRESLESFLPFFFFQQGRRKPRAPRWPRHWHNLWLASHASLPCLSQGQAPTSLPNAPSHMKGFFIPTSNYPIKLLLVRAWAPHVSLRSTHIPPTSIHPLQDEVSPSGTSQLSRAHNPWQQPALTHIAKKCKKWSKNKKGYKTSCLPVFLPAISRGI